MGALNAGRKCGVGETSIATKTNQRSKLCIDCEPYPAAKEKGK